MKTLFATILSINLVLAQSMIVLKKDQPAPFDGVLSDSAQMKEFRQINETNKLLDKQVLELKDLSLLKDEKIEIYKSSLEQANTKLEKNEKYTFWSNIGYFALGVIVTGVAAKAAIEATR